MILNRGKLSNSVEKSKKERKEGESLSQSAG
jgi:hypothetical protein